MRPSASWQLRPADAHERSGAERSELRRARASSTAARSAVPSRPDVLRDARAFGRNGDDGQRLAVVEDVAGDRVRIARLERRVARDGPSRSDGRLGSVL
jgi:hypothetical protein